MPNIEDLKKEVADLIGNSTDVESIKKVAAINVHLDEIADEQSKLLKSQGELVEELKKSVLNGSYKPDAKAAQEESGASAPVAKSLEQCAEEILKAQEGK